MQESIDAVIAVPIVVLTLAALGWVRRAEFADWLGVGRGR